MELVNKLFDCETPLSTIEKMLKEARESHKNTKDEDEEYWWRRFVFDLAQLTVIEQLDSPEKAIMIASLSVENDWENILWSTFRYTPWTSRDLAIVYTSTDKGWVHTIITTHLRTMTTGKMFARFNDSVREIKGPLPPLPKSKTQDEVSDPMIDALTVQMSRLLVNMLRRH
ncbi:MAG: hypothetical protein CMP20_09225 [Rickettsiales bacterium]|nr:hypothetical protein [Rickettsiales bacterium]